MLRLCIPFSLRLRSTAPGARFSLGVRLAPLSADLANGTSSREIGSPSRKAGSGFRRSGAGKQKGPQNGIPIASHLLAPGLQVPQHRLLVLPFPVNPKGGSSGRSEQPER